MAIVGFSIINMGQLSIRREDAHEARARILDMDVVRGFFQLGFYFFSLIINGASSSPFRSADVFAADYEVECCHN